MRNANNPKPSGRQPAARNPETTSRAPIARFQPPRDWERDSLGLLERLHAFAAGSRDAMSGLEAFNAIHLFGEKGDTRVFPVVCRIIAEDGRIADWLDDAVTETLPGILIKTFDGNPAPLRAAIRSRTADPFARASALAALGYLVRARGATSDAEMRSFLRLLRRDGDQDRGSVMWMTWALVVANLGYRSMRAEVVALRRAGFVAGGEFGERDFDQRISMALSDASGLAGFAEDMIAPLDDARSALRWLPGYAEA